ncbi:MAG: YbgC/FadM family acyl-CoA thioesterase [Clostridia bacterium]|nr:YbgC/FadM family acyl-CoA thioesterase [Clostridia bacterium]
MSFTYSRKINYYETDMMGVVHHSNYIRFLEEARCAWIESMGLPMREIEKRGFTIPVLEVNCKYKMHVTEGDILAIGINLTDYNGVRMTISYDVRDVKTGNVIIEAQTKHCFTNMDLKPINMKKFDEEINTKFEAAKLEK